MKRSRNIQLALMSTVPLFLTACDPPYSTPSPLIYQTVQQCIDDGKVGVEACRQEYDKALERHAREAPRFAILDDCIAKYGSDQCRDVRTADGQHWFMPALAGYMIGSMIQRHRDEDRRDYSYGYSSGWGSGGHPLYRERGDRAAWRTGEGSAVGYGSGARGPSAAPTTADTLSRGGFGRASAARASWGG